MPRTASETTDSPPAREDEILAVATKLFQELGYKGTPVTKIARAAGMTPANLYWYFPSKQEILRAVLVRLYRTSFEAIESADNPDAAAAARLASYVRVQVMEQLADADQDSNFGYLALQSSLDSEFKEELVAWASRHRVLMKDILRQGIDSGEFDIEDVSLTASMLMTSIEYVFLWFQHGARLSASDVADHYARLALRVVGARVAGITR